MSYADYDLNPLNLALDLASVGEGTMSFGELLRAQSVMFTDHGYREGDRRTAGRISPGTTGCRTCITRGTGSAYRAATPP